MKICPKFLFMIFSSHLQFQQIKVISYFKVIYSIFCLSVTEYFPSSSTNVVAQHRVFVDISSASVA